MAYDGWVLYDGVELVNLARTAALAETLGVDTVWVLPHQIDFIESTVGGTGYSDITTAPWYDAQFPESSEFVGVVPLSMAGLDDSTLASTVTESIGDGGFAGRGRNATLPIVCKVAIAASTERGAEFGLRWLNRRLRVSGNDFCAGSDLTYLRHATLNSPKAHRRDVRITRGTSVVNKRVTDCSSTWIVTFTLTANDPYEYGEPVEVITSLGAGADTGPYITASGDLVLVDIPCAGANYDPIYDPLAPALVPPPAPPNIFPAGWRALAGETFTRYYARVSPVEPSGLAVVPIITLSTTVEARMLRVSIWPNDAALDESCDPLFSVIVSYLPEGETAEFVLDGEQKVTYVWDGASPRVRRADTLAYSTEAGPVQWTAFDSGDGLLVTLDAFSKEGGYEGDGMVRLALDLMPKSD